MKRAPRLRWKLARRGRWAVEVDGWMFILYRLMGGCPTIDCFYGGLLKGHTDAQPGQDGIPPHEWDDRRMRQWASNQVRQWRRE